MAGFFIAITASLFAATLSDTVAAYRDACEPVVMEAWSTSFGPGGAAQSSHDRATQYCFYNHRAEISEYRVLGETGAPVFHGASITIWKEGRSAGRTLWVMVGVDGHTDIQLQWNGPQLTANGVGHDPQGEFIETWTTDFIRGGDQHFEMNRSYDGGKTWIAPFNTIEYLKTPAVPPPLPTQWSENFSAFAPALVEPSGFILLDGNAWGDFSLDGDGAPAGFTFASIAPQDGVWVWRTIEWSLDAGVLSVSDQAIPQ